MRFVVTLLIAGAVMRPLAGQGLGGSAGLGVYRSLSPAGFDHTPGVGLEITGRWAFRSGLSVGLGAGYIVFPQGDDRGAAFLDGQYAPSTSPTRRIQPIIGVRVGPFLGGGVGDGDGNPLLGVQAGPVLGLSVRAGAGVSLTVLGDLSIALDSNDYHTPGSRRFLPGLQVGMRLH